MTLALRDVGWTYAGASAPAVRAFTGRVGPGERVLLTGPSGCGKSTLLRLAAGILQRFGDGVTSGRVAVAGRDPAVAAARERAALVGLVSQDPGDQVITGTVADEVAFAPESAGWPAARIEARIGAMLERVGLDVDPGRDPRTLSGGQQQRLVVAASLAVGAPLLLLDEPLAQLDPAGARALLARLDALAEEGTAVLLVEHRLEPCLGWCDRVWWMEEGALRHEGRPDGLSAAVLAGGGLRVPDLLAVEAELAPRGRSLSEIGVDPLRPRRPPFVAPPVPDPAPAPLDPVLEGIDLRHRYGDRVALAGVSLAVGAGERVAVLGANGAGKSTLLAALASELGTGTVRAAGRVVPVPQDPDLSLFNETVRDELAYGPREARLPAGEVARVVREVAGALGLDPLLERAPQALSRGQRLRVAVGAALACRPRVLLLDEPTAGQDEANVDALLAALSRALSDAALVFATHDVRLALRFATRVLVLDQGRVIADVRPIDLPGALPRDHAIELPPLAALCAARGWPPLDPAAFASRWA